MKIHTLDVVTSTSAILCNGEAVTLDPFPGVPFTIIIQMAEGGDGKVGWSYAFTANKVPLLTLMNHHLVPFGVTNRDIELGESKDEASQTSKKLFLRYSFQFFGMGGGEAEKYWTISFIFGTRPA